MQFLFLKKVLVEISKNIPAKKETGNRYFIIAVFVIPIHRLPDFCQVENTERKTRCLTADILSIFNEEHRKNKELCMRQSGKKRAPGRILKPLKSAR